MFQKYGVHVAVVMDLLDRPSEPILVSFSINFAFFLLLRNMITLKLVALGLYLKLHSEENLETGVQNLYNESITINYIYQRMQMYITISGILLAICHGH